YTTRFRPGPWATRPWVRQAANDSVAAMRRKRGIDGAAMRPGAAGIALGRRAVPSAALPAPVSQRRLRQGERGNGCRVGAQDPGAEGYRDRARPLQHRPLLRREAALRPDQHRQRSWLEPCEHGERVALGLLVAEDERPPRMR